MCRRFVVRGRERSTARGEVKNGEVGFARISNRFLSVCRGEDIYWRTSNFQPLFPSILVRGTLCAVPHYSLRIAAAVLRAAIDKLEGSYSRGTETGTWVTCLQTAIGIWLTKAHMSDVWVDGPPRPRRSVASGRHQVAEVAIRHW